jgi:hypothetical protein
LISELIEKAAVSRRSFQTKLNTQHSKIQEEQIVARVSGSDLVGGYRYGAENNDKAGLYQNTL